MELLYQDHLRECLTNQMQALNNYRLKFSSSIIPHKQWFSFFLKRRKQSILHCSHPHPTTAILNNWYEVKYGSVSKCPHFDLVCPKDIVPDVWANVHAKTSVPFFKCAL